MVWFESEMNISESDMIYSGKFNDNILTICISVLTMTFQGLIIKKVLGIKNMFCWNNFVVLNWIKQQSLHYFEGFRKLLLVDLFFFKK